MIKAPDEFIKKNPDGSFTPEPLPEGGRTWDQIRGEWVDCNGESLNPAKVKSKLELELRALQAKIAAVESQVPNVVPVATEELEGPEEDPATDTRPLEERPYAELKKMATDAGKTFAGNISRIDLIALLQS